MKIRISDYGYFMARFPIGSTVAFLGITLPYFKFIDDKLESEEKGVS